MTVCRSEEKKNASVRAAPEEQEDGEVQMALPVAQAAPGMPTCPPPKTHLMFAAHNLWAVEQHVQAVNLACCCCFTCRYCL